MKENFKKYWYVILILVLILIYYVISNSSEVEFEVMKEDVLVEKEEVDEINSITTYYVDVKGEVKTPGVYEIESDKRVIDVISKAGGLTKNADTSLLNLSKKIKDEMSIKIYSKTEVKRAKENVNKEPEVIEIIKEIEKECVCPDIKDVCTSLNDAVIDDINGVLDDEKQENISDNNEDNNKYININTATKEELMTIPNIGESKANSIIEYRNKNKFEKIEDILNVSGIGQSVFEKIKEFITV